VVGERWFEWFEWFGAGRRETPAIIEDRRRAGRRLSIIQPAQMMVRPWDQERLERITVKGGWLATGHPW